MVSDDNEKLRQFLNPTAALIFAMEAVRRTNIVADRTAWVSYKGFAQRYMAIINRLPQDFLALTLLSRYDMICVGHPVHSPVTTDKSLMEFTRICWS